MSIETQETSLKNINFLAWRVGRNKQALKHQAIHRSLYERPRQRNIIQN